MCESSMCFKLQNRGGWLVWQSRNGGSGDTTYRRVCVWRALSAAVGASRLHGWNVWQWHTWHCCRGGSLGSCLGGHASVGASRRGCFGACACGKCCGNAVEPEATIRKEMKHVMEQNALQVCWKCALPPPAGRAKRAVEAGRAAAVRREERKRNLGTADSCIA
jgi:hypothetical protein